MSCTTLLKCLYHFSYITQEARLLLEKGRQLRLQKGSQLCISL